MATEQQIALSRPARLPASHVSKSSRQVVPAFLQKLYEMVNDPKNSDLIRWSDSGDTFLVLDHERFAREVLGRWFKHQNFSSFVRQLNMYGFHKIPQLQQGVLKSETDTESWNFRHSNFRRGQPDLLCLIQRKKQTTQSSDEGSVEVRAASAAGSTAGLTQGQMLDLHTIVQGIAAIKRHQTTISAELIELKRSNQLLWQDAMEARERHKKQQDTINRILKFLAGVFGKHVGSNHHKDDVVNTSRSNHAVVVPRRSARFMIEDAQHDKPTKVDIIEVEDPESANAETNTLYGQSTYRYPAIETQASAPSPATSVTQSETMGSSVAESDYYGSAADAPVMAAGHSSNMLPGDGIRTPDPHTTENATTPLSSMDKSDASSKNPIFNSALARPITPNRASAFEVDPRVQDLINHLSAEQINHLVQSLSQTIADAHDSNDPAQHSFHQTHCDYPQPLPSPSLPLIAPPPPGTHGAEGLIPFGDTQTEQGKLSPRLERHWQATEDIDNDVNAMNTEINNLIDALGLGDQMLQSDTNPSGTGGFVSIPHTGPENSISHVGVTSVPDSHSLLPMNMMEPSVNSIGTDFDFDTLFNSIPRLDGTDYRDIHPTTFLDEVPTPSDGTASPVVHIRANSPMQSSTLGGRKRKSDVSELEGALGAASVNDSLSIGSKASPLKTKRRKDK